MEALTDAQATLLETIERLKHARGHSPTLQELAVALGVKAPSVYETLKRLEAKGHIRRMPHKARAIEILHPQKPRLVAIPLVGTVAAGQPLLAQENRLGEIMVPSSVLCGRCFALKVAGDSMIDMDIFAGDYVVVRQQPLAENGDIVVAMIGEEATVKRLYIDGTRIELRPENKTHTPIIIAQGDDLTIIGKVVQVCSGANTHPSPEPPPQAPDKGEPQEGSDSQEGSDP